MTDLRSRAAAVTQQVADRLAAPAEVAEHARRAALAGGRTWAPGSLHTGHPGIAVLHARLGRPGRARAHVAAAGRSAPTPATLQALLPAALVQRSAHGGHDRLVRQAEAATLAAARRALRETADGTDLSSTGRLLLELTADPAADAAVHPVLADVLRHLGSIPQRALVHGPAGPLALLALARLRGFEVAGAAIERLAGYPTPGATWCYGVAGMARAQQLAGAALGDHALTARAADGIRGALAAGAADPSLCHGEAGLLAIARRMLGGDPAVDALAERLLERFDPAVPFGFGEPGLLHGATGIALALADLADPPPADRFSWDAALLLS